MVLVCFLVLEGKVRIRLGKLLVRFCRFSGIVLFFIFEFIKFVGCIFIVLEMRGYWWYLGGRGNKC